MNQLINMQYVANSLIFSFMGVAIFVVGFWILDRMTPFALWKEILEEHNTALAIMIGGISIGICIIIASAIHG